MSLLDDEGERLIEALLQRWAEAREHGLEVDLRGLCHDHPELVEEVRRRIEALDAWDRFTDTVCDPATGPCPQTIPVPTAPESALIPLQLKDLQFLARGGLGVVYSARDSRLGRDLAVKFPAAGSGAFSEAEMNRRLLREVKVTAALEHPGIVPVYGLGQDSRGRPCYAMRLITGKTLARAVAEYHAGRQAIAPARRTELRKDEAFRFLLQRLRSACATVAYAHSRGYLHRDLKPDHILLGEFDSTLVVDWGLTKAMKDPEVTPWNLNTESSRQNSMTHTGLGTIGFASPEQLLGDWERVGPASDVYSLGAILYVLLTNRPPISGQPSAEILRVIEMGDLVSPRKRNPEIPRSLEAVCLKALAPLPEDRYPSAQALSDDLDRWLADSPVQAYAEPWWRRARRTLDRHSLLLFLVLAGAAGGILSATAGWYRGRLRDQEIRALEYVNSERTAREQILGRNPGWASVGLREVARAARLSSALRSETTLRSLAASCLSGVDLRPVAHLTAIPVGCLAFSPTGEEIAVGELFGDENCRIQQIDVASGQVTREHVVGVNARVNPRPGIRAIAYSPDGRWIAAGCRDGNLLVWSVTDSRSAPVRIGGLGSRVVGLGFTPDSMTLVAAAHQGMLTLSDWSGSRDWVETRRIPVDGEVTHLVISPDGSRVVCAGQSGARSIPLAELRGLERLPRDSRTRPSGVLRLAISPDGQRLALPSAIYGTLTIGQEPSAQGMVDADTGVLHQDETDHVEFSPDGTLVVTGSSDNSLKLWDLAAGRVLLRRQVYSESGVFPVFDPGGVRLAVGSTEGVWLYDLLGRDMCQVRAVGSSVVLDFAFLRAHHGDPGLDSPSLAVLRAVEDPQNAERPFLEVWERDPLRPVSTIGLQPPSSQDEGLETFMVHPETRKIAFHYSTTTRVLDLNLQPPRGWTASVFRPLASTFSIDGRYFWVSTRDHQGIAWELGETERLVRWTFEPPPEPQGRVNISCMAGGKEIMVAGTSAGRLFRSRGLDGQLVPLTRIDAPIQALALSPDEGLVACGTQRGGLDLIELGNARVVFHADPHAERIEQLQFDPSGCYLASLARDRELILWQVSKGSLRELLRIRQPLRRAPARVRFSPNGRYLGVLFHAERGVHVWDLPRLRGELSQLGLGWEDPQAAASRAAELNIR